MFVWGNFILGLAVVIDMILSIYMWLIIIVVIISWIRLFSNPYGQVARFLSPYNPLMRFLYSMTEPVLWRIRRLLPFQSIGLDFSPLIVILIIYFLRTFLVRSLVQLAYRLQ